MRRLPVIAVLSWQLLSAQSTAPVAFEVVSIKHADITPGVTPCMCEPGGRIAYRLTPLKFIIQRAYDLQDLQVSGPDWLTSERFNVDAKLPEGVSARNVPAMFQTLLKERFKLSAHSVEKELAGFVLKTGQSGAGLMPADPGGYSMPRDRTGFHLQGTLTVQTLADVLSQNLQQPVVDETGLEGRFRLRLDFAPDSAQAPDAVDGALAPPLPAAMLDQLGIKMERRKVHLKVLIVDHIERTPTEN